MENQAAAQETTAPVTTEAPVVAEVSSEATVSNEPVQSVLDGPINTAAEATETENSIDTKEAVSDFITNVPDDYKLMVQKKGFKGVEDVLKSYTNLESMMGKKFDELSNDELKAVYTKLGAPESPEGYEFEKANLPEGIEDGMSDWFANKAHELGISKKAAQELRNEFVAKQTEEYTRLVTNAQAQAKEDLSALKKEFGSAFDERTSLAVTALNEFGGDEVREVLSQAGLANNPALVKMFSEIGKLTAEGNISTDKSASKAQFGMTPKEAADKINEKFLDKGFMQKYYSQTDPGHADAVKQIEELYKIKNSG